MVKRQRLPRHRTIEPEDMARVEALLRRAAAQTAFMAAQRNAHTGVARERDRTLAEAYALGASRQRLADEVGVRKSVVDAALTRNGGAVSR